MNFKINIKADIRTDLGSNAVLKIKFKKSLFVVTASFQQHFIGYEKDAYRKRISGNGSITT